MLVYLLATQYNDVSRCRQSVFIESIASQARERSGARVQSRPAAAVLPNSFYERTQRQHASVLPSRPTYCVKESTCHPHEELHLCFPPGVIINTILNRLTLSSSALSVSRSYVVVAVDNAARRRSSSGGSREEEMMDARL